MCSILFSTKPVTEQSLENLIKRGPDYQNIISKISLKREQLDTISLDLFCGTSLSKIMTQ